MGAPCTICHHPDRAAIDAAVVRGESERALARRFEVSRDALARHRRSEHISPALARVLTRREERKAEQGPTTALERLEELYQLARDCLGRAQAGGQTATQLAAIREAKAVVELIAKITGELKAEGPQTVVNIMQLPETTHLIRVIRETFADQPDRLAVVAERLRLPE